MPVSWTIIAAGESKEFHNPHPRARNLIELCPLAISVS